MTCKISRVAAMFLIAAIALTFYAEIGIENPKPPATLEWGFMPKDPTLDTRIETYRVRMAAAIAFEAFLAQASLVLATFGAVLFFARRLMDKVSRRRGHS